MVSGVGSAGLAAFLQIPSAGKAAPGALDPTLGNSKKMGEAVPSSFLHNE